MRFNQYLIENIKINNQKEVNSFSQSISTLSNKGTSWISSKKNQFLNSLTKKKKRGIQNISANKAYLIGDSTGSIYKSGNSIGYFVRGSIIVFGKQVENKAGVRAGIEVEIFGSIFKVIADQSFANTSPIFSQMKTPKQSGIMPIDKIEVIELKDALAEFSKIKNKAN